ncbi:TPA: hypothetical protein EYP70_06480 [Candidatus Bathyarchaeota archaeon]|nr:hypothetical protein [Candidatus Bathyarchaeota archaeon]
MDSPLDDSFERYVKNPLWPILVETVHSLTMYPYHKNYVSEKIMQEEPEITPRELSVKLGITFGEALVILYEIRKKNATE